jgi:hypothetical protein
MAMGIVTLVVLYLLIAQLREQGAADRPITNQPPAASAPLPQPTGPTDEDSEEADSARDEFQALTDGTLGLGAEEMVPYNRLVTWVQNQSFARLWARAKKNLAYTYLYDDAPQHRGQLVALDVELRLVRDAKKNDAGVHLYEAWATTRESGNHLYDLIIVDFPPQMPVGERLHERATFAGYFLKVQGYESGVAQPGRPPEKAPMLIGRLNWKPAATTAQTDERQEWIWIAVAVALVVVVLAARFIIRMRSRSVPVRAHLPTPPDDGVIPVEEWLEQYTQDPQAGGEQIKDKTE